MKSGKSPQDFPYKTYLNILHGPLELIDLQKLADACTDKWYNQTLCKVNDSVIRLAAASRLRRAQRCAPSHPRTGTNRDLDGRARGHCSDRRLNASQDR